MPTSVLAQTDTEFWFAAPEVSSAFNYDRPIYLRITAYTTAANISISQPANPTFPVQNITLAPNMTQSIDLSPWIDLVECKPGNVIQNKGIRISSDNKIAVYYEVDANGPNPELFALKGKNALGNQFIISSQYLLNNTASHSPTPYSSFNIVATEDNTLVNISATANIVGHSANTPFTITLNRGQTFAAIATSTLANQHLQGSTVTSNKPIAITLSDDLLQGTAFGGPCEDLAGDQTVPVGILGTEYIAFKSNLSSPFDKLYITATQNGTTISQDGVVGAPVNSGQTIQLSINNATTYIQSSAPVYVYHLGGVACEVGSAILPKINCTGSSSVSITRSTVESFIITLLVKNGGQGSFLINNNPGVITSSLFNLVPGTADWYWAKISLPLTSYANGSVIRLQNTSRVFQMGVMQGGSASGAAFGYFSDFNSFNANANAADSILCTGESLNIFADSILTSSYSWSGPSGFSSNQPNIVIPDINSGNSGYYHLEMTIPGCGTYKDSIFVTVNQPTASTINLSICEGETYQGYSLTGTYVNTFSGSNGCDSTRTLNLLIKPRSNSFITNTICQGGSFYGYSATGIYTDTLVAANGCDSIRIINLTVNPPVQTNLTATICEGGSHLGYTTSGIYRDTLAASNGCDSIRILNLIVLPRVFATINVSICEGQSYQGYSVPGIYIDTLVSFSGCDSVRTLNLSVNPKVLKTVNYSMCDGETYFGHTTSGTYIDTLISASGCDSIRTLILDIIPKTTSYLPAVICEGSSFMGYTVSGTYIDTLTGGNGCDSIRTIDLIVKNRSISQLSATICRGQNYYGYIDSGNYIDTLISVNGCDSIRIIDLMVQEPIHVELGPDKSICFGDSVLINAGNFPGSTYTWNFNSGGPTLMVYNEGIYSVEIENSCGIEQDNIFVRVDNCEIYVPNTFTPNNDGKNETFKITHSHILPDFKLIIYNRWGQKVFESFDSLIGWDGIFNGKPASLGAYVWQCQYSRNGMRQYMKGTVLLLR